MDILFSFQDNLLKQVTNNFYRSLYDRINWQQRMLAIKGLRGAGKTTLILQYIKYKLGNARNEALYVTADHHWFYTHTLLEVADEHYKNGGRHLFIDEVHKYPGWSNELKLIYDGYPDLKVAFTSSSALDIYRGEADLSRRVISYELTGLSFREFLELSGTASIETFSFQAIRKDHVKIAKHITNQFQPLPVFKNYLTYGYLPIYTENSATEISQKLEQIINTTVESDLSYIQQYTAATAHKVKRLLGILAESVPFKPNISALAKKLDVSRDSIYAWLVHLQKARLLNLLSPQGKGTSLLQKPEKIYLENTNLSFALKSIPDVGSIRETFLLNQLLNNGLDVHFPKSGDFFTNDTFIEVGGKTKTAKQVDQYDQFIVAADQIEIGYKDKVPLWLFGMLY